ncbi:MAG: hypothetical protein ACTSW1_13240 [Candidatus Hodarchaeales archaeon]
MNTSDPLNDTSQDDMTLFEGSNYTKQIAIGMILAAVYAVSVMIPMSGFIAATGVASTISFTICIAPLFGVLLGPSKGAVFGMIAGILATFVSTAVGGLYLFVPTIIFGPAIAGLLGGLCLSRTTEVKGLIVPGPLLTSLYFVLIIVLFLVPNSVAWWFITPYILAAIVALILQFKEIDVKGESTVTLRYLFIIFLAVIGTFADFSMMTLGAVYILAVPAEVFGFVIFPIMLVERTAAVIVSAIVLSIVLKTFKDQL